MPAELTALCNLLNSVCVDMCEYEKAVTANIPVKTLKYWVTCSFQFEGWVGYLGITCCYNDRSSKD